MLLSFSHFCTSCVCDPLNYCSPLLAGIGSVLLLLQGLQAQVGACRQKPHCTQKPPRRWLPCMLKRPCPRRRPPLVQKPPRPWPPCMLKRPCPRRRPPRALELPRQRFLLLRLVPLQRPTLHCHHVELSCQCELEYHLTFNAEVQVSAASIPKSIVQVSESTAADLPNDTRKLISHHLVIILNLLSQQEV